DPIGTNKRASAALAFPAAADYSAQTPVRRANHEEQHMPSDKKIRVAIVGLGFGAEFIPIYQRHPNAEMYAVCRRSEKALHASADKFGIKARYTDLHKLLGDPNVDAVHINSPIPDHAPQSLAALRAGKHVACTVPMATSVEECRQLVEA